LKLSPPKRAGLPGEDEKMEMICFEISLDTLRYARGVGALTIWGIISYSIFKWNLGKHIFLINFNK